MKPVAIESQTLEKTRTTNSHFSCFKNVIKKRSTTLIILLLLQFPILYFLYNSEMTSFTKDQFKFTPIQINITRSAILASTVKLDGTDNHENILNTKLGSNKTVAQEAANITNSADESAIKETITTKPETTKAPQLDNQNINDENNVVVVEINKNEDGKNDEKNKENGSESEDAGKNGSEENVKKEVEKSEDEKEIEKKEDGEILPECPETPPGLQGPLAISFAHSAIPFEKLNQDLPQIKDGGYFKPPYCIAKDKVAIIIPFRDREEHLRYFLEYMHPILSRQQLEYRIYIINQFGKGKFNRAKLMNVGYAESLKDLGFGCFVFHDVDLILENDKSIYSCPERPRHLSAGVDKFNYKLPYSTIFGGVTELTKKQMEKVNGYSNSFWGWGGEDDDMFNRLRIKGYTIMRYPMEIARYKMISHAREKGNEANPQRFDLIRKTGLTMDHDGINSLEYKVIARENHQLYTNITVDLLNP